jgi:hypothetical protein
MLLDASSLKVVRTNGGDEVLARAASRHTRSMTPDLFSTASARVPLPSPNPPRCLSVPAHADRLRRFRRDGIFCRKTCRLPSNSLTIKSSTDCRRRYSPNRGDAVGSLPSQFSRRTIRGSRRLPFI